MLQAFDNFGGNAHISFISPKVNPATATALDVLFDTLRKEYSDIDWSLFMNESFASEILHRTLAATEATSDTSELFVRAARLLDAGDTLRGGQRLGPGPMPHDPRPPTTEQLQPPRADHHENAP